MEQVKTCFICKLPIEAATSITKLSCSHEFHARCAHGPLTRNYGYCPVCVPPEATDVISSREDTKHHPLDFGDDVHVQTLLERRLLIFKQYESFCQNKGQESITMTSMKTLLSKREKEVCNEVHGNTAEELITDEKSNLYRTALDMIVMAMQSGVDQGTGEPVKTTEMDECMENQLDFLIQHKRTSTLELATKHGVDAHVLIRRGYTITTLFQYGYTLNDLILFQTTWTDMKGLKFSSSAWILHKDKLPVDLLFQLYGITVNDVFVDICESQFSNFVALQFTYEEMRFLGIKNISELLNMGMKRKHLQDMKLDMIQWRHLGMTASHLKALHVDPTLLKTIKWTDTADKILVFEDKFGIKLESLERPPDNPPPKKVLPPAQPNKKMIKTRS